MGHTYTKKIHYLSEVWIQLYTLSSYLLNLSYKHPSSQILKQDSESKRSGSLKSSSGDSNVHQDSETLG